MNLVLLSAEELNQIKFGGRIRYDTISIIELSLEPISLMVGRPPAVDCAMQEHESLVMCMVDVQTS